MPGSPRRLPGRPRSDEARRAILAATAELIGTQGFSATTMDGIAARAGVGKQTIYRWWPTKADVTLEACAPRPEFAVPVPDLGTFRDDLREFLRIAFSLAADETTVDLLRNLMVEAQVNRDFGRRFRSRFLEPRRAAFRTMVDRASDRGHLPQHLTPSGVTDVVFGSFWYRLLATETGPDDALADELVAMLTHR